MIDGPADALTIDAVPGRLAEVRALVRAYARDVGADEEAVSDLVQAVDELACNVIEHGYRGVEGSIEIGLATVDGAIQVRIRDAAPPFDPGTVAEPRLDLPLDQRPLGGMGVHLARTLTDGMDHRILPGGGNETTLTKLVRPTEARETDDGHHDGATEP
jgi:anti-sigma regulatory factor (Ser/Thr protein kinase)